MCVDVFLVVEPFVEGGEFDADASFLELVDDEVVCEGVASDVDFSGDENGGVVAGFSEGCEGGGSFFEEGFESVEVCGGDFACGSCEGAVTSGLALHEVVEFVGEFFVEGVDGAWVDFCGSGVVAHGEEDVCGDETAVCEGDGAAGNSFKVVVVGWGPDFNAVVEVESFEGDFVEVSIDAEAARAASSGHEEGEFLVWIGVVLDAFDEGSEGDGHGDAFFSGCEFSTDTEGFPCWCGHGFGLVSEATETGGEGASPRSESWYDDAFLFASGAKEVDIFSFDVVEGVGGAERASFGDVFSDAVEEGLDTGARSGVTGVTVGFDDGVGFTFHDVGVEVEGEGIWAASVVGAPNGVGVW